MKMRNFTPLSLSVYFSRWHVDGLSSKRVAPKVDVIGPENILFAGASVHLSAENFTGWGSEGVNSVTCGSSHAVDRPRHQ